ncbi:uncharacterized protein LOC133803465 [Humulus lupulus]|uniref:uncharacterized protein LOC133803465 n=1 Tax=Humulus lupulus TaxID=3486 RepID=UPI002B41112E|nr:uncharacterized protein LOC133803465 [Humulus lupulus]
MHFDRKPVIVKPWSADLDTLKAVKTVPVWIRLQGLGLQYWGTKCLSALVSTIGNPLLVDKVTKERSMMQFARVLVEIEIAEALPKSIQFLNEKGQLMEQLLEFEWLPTQCSGCKVFGHTVSMCKRKPTEVWRQKGHTGIVETKQGNTEQQPVSEEKNVTSGEKVAVTKDLDDKDLDAGQGISQSQAQVRNADHTDVAPDRNVNVTDKLEWSAPKRGGGLKKVNRKIQSNLRNSYGVLQDKIGLGAFLETKLYGDKIRKMMSASFKGWNYYSGTNLEGRILVLWLPQVVTIEILMESDQFVHIYVKGINSSKIFCVTFVYGRNTIKGRFPLWSDLAGLSFPVKPWRALGLVDELRSIGSHFTWTNNQENDNRIYSKLDRVFKNEEWLDLFPQAEALFNWDLLSDHCYCIIKMGAAINSGLKPFRFFNMWTEHRSFKDTVLQSWNKPIKGRGLVRIVRKLSRLKVVLSKFNKLVVGDVAMHYNLAKEKFQNAQGLLQRNPHSTELQREEALDGACLAYHSKAYDSFLRQKSKIDWLRYGDDNTAYFHACLKQRRANNCITSGVLDSGELIEKFEDVVTHFVHHFQKIMGSSSNASVPVQSSCFRLGHCLSLEQQVKLVRPFTKKEVKDALFSISSIKSPGPDGFGSLFFKAMWGSLEAEISEAAFEFFESGVLPEEVNNATICLVPKVETPTKAIDFRPIACCNAIYKCISKILSGRLATVLPSLVHQNQGAFVKNRLLAHNILLLQDIIKGYNRKNASPRCVMKIDLSKAYDMLDWDFMETILSKYCFPSKFIKWIMACLKDPSYLILMNGRIQGEFRGKKGLRQGDPLSPLLSVLAMEYCTRLLSQASLDKRFRFHPKCKSLKLVNLCFADDLVIFCKGVSNSVQILRDSFTEFCMASGLSANLQKSQVFFGGLDDRETQQLLGKIQFTEGKFPLKYLGVPLRTTKRRAGDCAIIITKIQQKLHTWASRHLSFAGRAQLVNTVLLSLRSFWMSIFMLPKSVTKETDRLCRNFLWGVKEGNVNRSKLHFTTWSQVCLPKCMGGLGFKEGSSWNTVLLAKFVWAVSSKQDILWVKWVDSIYLKGQDFWSYSIPQDVSWYWRRLVKLRSVFSDISLAAAMKGDKLCLKVMYYSLLNRKRVEFADVVWCSMAVPKHRFILWQASLGHLLTRDKLHQCNLELPSLLCPACELEQESHAHLFFACPFSQQLRAHLLDWLGRDIWPITYANWCTWMCGKLKSLKHQVLAAALAAAVYMVWRNRNLCVFELRSLAIGLVIQLIKSSIRSRLARLPKLKVRTCEVAFLEAITQM